MSRVLITGIMGQDGFYLADALRTHEVYGMYRRSTSNTYAARGAELVNSLGVVLLDGDMTDEHSLRSVVERVNPDFVFNLAAQSFVGVSWQQPQLTFDVNTNGVLRLLEACRRHNPGIRFFQASTSEMFGSSAAPQHEGTLFRPRSPYAISKVAAHHLVTNYRDSYDMFACAGIMFNHESSRRGADFVTQKIVKGLLNIKAGKQDELLLGDVSVRRDWGFAGDYVQAMIKMLFCQAEPTDYVVATGESHTVLEFLQLACQRIGVDLDHRIKLNHPSFIRPAEVTNLCGDAMLIEQELGWMPTMTFEELVDHMIEGAQCK